MLLKREINELGCEACVGISPVSHFCTKFLKRSNLREERLVLAYSLNRCNTLVWKSCNRSMRQLFTCINNQEAEDREEMGTGYYTSMSTSVTYFLQ